MSDNRFLPPYPASNRTQKIINRLRDDRGLGDRTVLAREAADELERLLAALTSHETKEG